MERGREGNGGQEKRGGGEVHNGGHVYIDIELRTSGTHSQLAGEDAKAHYAIVGVGGNRPYLPATRGCPIELIITKAEILKGSLRLEVEGVGRGSVL